MPVQKWDHVTDPLDVDKKKHKAALLHKQIETPFMAIKETENENDDTFSQASNQPSFKEMSEQKSATRKSLNQQPLRTNSIQLMSDMYSNPITTEKMTLVNNVFNSNDNVAPAGLAKTFATSQHASPDRSVQPHKKFSQTQEFKAIQRFNTTKGFEKQFSSIRSTSKEMPVIQEQQRSKLNNQHQNEQQIQQVVHMYDDADSSDDYSLTDLKAQFEEQQKAVRGDLVSLINNKKELAKTEVLAKLQSTSTRKHAEDRSQGQTPVRRQKTNTRQLTEQAVHAAKPAASYRSDVSQSLMSQAGFKEMTADEPTAEAESRSWFERQNLNAKVTPKVTPFASARQAAPDQLTEEQLQQIHQYMRNQQQPDADRSRSNSSKNSRVEQDLQQWQTTQKLIQKEKDLQDALDELEREKQEIQAQKQALYNTQHQQKQAKANKDKAPLKAQLTFGFGDNLEKALAPEDLDSQKNFTQTKTTQQMHEEHQKKLKQQQFLMQENAMQEKIFRQQSQQYETDVKQKRQFQALNSTQKVFPSLRAGHSLFVGGALTRDDSELDHKSIRTQGAASTGSNKKIGGLARRKYSNQMAKIGSKRTLRNDFESERIGQAQVNQSNYQDRSESIDIQNEKEEKYVSSAQIEPNHTQTHSQHHHSSKVPSHGHQQNYNNELGEQAMSQPPDLKIPDIRSNNSPQAPDSLSKKSNAKLQQIKDQMNMLQAEIVKMDNPTPPRLSTKTMEEKTDTEAKKNVDQTKSDTYNINYLQSTPAQRQELPNSPPGIEIQTADLNPNLRMQIRRSRRSFQNQVYLDDSQDQLKSTISHYTEKVKKKQAEEQQQLYRLKKQQILDNLNQIKLYEKEIHDMEMEIQDEDQETEKQFQDTHIAHKEGERAIQTNVDEMSKATEQNPMVLMQDQSETVALQFSPQQLNKGNDPRARDAQTDAKARDAETEAKARDVALDPMICEKSTDPRMVDKQIGAWKRDGVMQTSKESQRLRDSQLETNTVKAVNESFIKKQKPSITVEHKGTTASPFFKQQLVNNGGTQYSLDIAVNTKQNGPINQEEQDLIRQRESFDKTVELVDNDSRSQLIEQNQVMDMAIQPGSLDKKPRSDSHSVRKSTQKQVPEAESGKLQESMMVNDQLRNVLIDSQNMENSPLLQHDFDKESEGLPVYHDHLIEEILNQKVKNLREYQARSREKVRNDSRSTQQMFEHQFGMGKQKERFQSVKHGMNKASHLSSPVPSNNINFVGYQNQQPSMFKPLPPIIQERESIQQFEPHVHPNTVKSSNPKFQYKHSTMYSDPTSIAGGQMKFSNQNGSIQFQNPNNYPDEAANCEICRNQQQMQHQHQHHAFGQHNLGRAGSRNFGQRHQSLPAVHHGNHGGNQYQSHQHHHGHYGAQNSPVLPPNIFQNGGNMQFQNQNNQNGFQNPGQQYESRNRGFANNTQAQSYLNQNFGQQQHEYGQWGSNQNPDRSPPFPSAQFANNNNSGFNPTQENSRQNLDDQQRPAADDDAMQRAQIENNRQQHPLKHFKGQDLEMYYMEKKLKPEVEKEIKKGFFEIRKKFNQDEQHAVQTARGGMLTQTNDANEEVQVYVSHICLQNYHPIFCKMNVDTVKLILKYSQIVYLKKGQTLYAPGFNESNFYVILFGKCKLNSSTGSQRQIGNILNIGWTIGEEILFKTQEQKAEKKKYQRNEVCQAISEACVLGVKKKNLTQIKKCLYEKSAHEEFSKIEIVLRGNHLVKKDWN